MNRAAKTSLEYTNSSFKYLPTKVTNPRGGALSYGYDAKGNAPHGARQHRHTTAARMSSDG